MFVASEPKSEENWNKHATRNSYDGGCERNDNMLIDAIVIVPLPMVICCAACGWSSASGWIEELPVTTPPKFGCSAASWMLLNWCASSTSGTGCRAGARIFTGGVKIVYIAWQRVHGHKTLAEKSMIRYTGAEAPCILSGAHRWTPNTELAML